MDRTFTESARRIGLLVGVLGLATVGPGCSKMRTYRAQNSPLPLPGLGLLNRSEVKLGMNTEREPNRTRVAVHYSDAPPVARRPTGPAEPKAPATLAEIKSQPPAEALAISTPEVGETPKAATPLAEARALVAQGRAALAAMSTYQVMLNRQERVGITLQPAEDVILSLRRAPHAVRLEWPDGPHKGREVIYSADTDGKLHIHTPNTLLPVPDLAIAPDSPLVMRNSRHPITEAGLDVILAKLEQSFDTAEAGSSIEDDGIDEATEVGRTCHKLVFHNAQGESWTFLLDSQTGLPASVLGTAANGDLLEHDKFGVVQANLSTLAEASAFNAEQRWSRGRGLFGRVAEATGSDDEVPRR